MAKVRIEGRYGYASAHDMYELLTGSRTGRLPADGMALRRIQGVLVYVKPLGVLRRRKRHDHRVIAICNCGQHVPVGRLHQHVCKEVK
jgi:hypothetical protein